MSTAVQAVTNPELVSALLAGDPAAIQSELERATLLVPASSADDGVGIILRGRSQGGRMLIWAFTDKEALLAWDRRPPDAVVALAPDALARHAGGDGSVIALNAAGPGAFLVGVEALQATLSHGASGNTPEAEPGSYVDLEARPEARGRIRQALERSRSASADGRLQNMRRELTAAVAACGEIGDRLHGSAAALDLAACLARIGDTGPALETWERAADVLTLFGESDLAAAALLEASEAAVEAGAEADAERLSIAALELCVGPEFTDRLVAVWGRLREQDESKERS